MRAFWLHLLLLCLSCMLLDGVVDNGGSRPAVVKIGVLFHSNSTIGRVAKIAIDEAVREINTNASVLHGTRLNLTVLDSSCNGFVGFIRGLELLEKEVVAVIGPQSSVVAHMISKVSTDLQIPLVSFSATDRYFSRWGSPFFVRTTNSDLYQMTAIADMIDYFGWKEVTAVFIDDDYGRNGIVALDGALIGHRSKLSHKAAISPVSGLNRSEIMDVLITVAMLESRVIVLHVTPDMGRLVFAVAKYLGMMGNGYVWIATDWLSLVIDSYAPFRSEMLNEIQGVLALRQHVPDSEAKEAFVSRWDEITGGSVPLNVYGLYAYDTVWLIARALDAYLSQGGNISFSTYSELMSIHDSNLHLEALRVFDGGKDLLEKMLQSDFVGLTGPIKFDDRRARIRPAYDILNVIGNGVRNVGYWSNYSSLSIVPPEVLYSSPPNRSSAAQHLKQVFWPDGTTDRPRGWVFPYSSKPLIIGVPIRVSFKDFVTREPGTNDAFTGFCIDVFQAAIGLLPYPVPFRFVGFGDGRQNPQYNDLVNMIATGNFDGAVGDIAITTDRTKIVDFTQPYASSGLVVVAPFKKLNSGAWAFLRPFRPGMWGFIAICFISIGAVIWILEHKINDDFRGSPREQCLTILWFGLSTLTFSHRENTVSCHARAVLIIWLFVVLILTSSYTASLTSILTVQQLSSSIDGIESLRHNHELIGYQVGSFVQQYLTEELGIDKSRLVELNSPEEYAEALKHGRVSAVVDEHPYIELFLSSQCDFRIVGPEFTRGGWGFAFPRDSPLTPDLSTAILKLSENGDLQRIHDKWLTTSSCSQDNTEIESSQLHPQSFSGLFLLCGITCVIALAVYFTKICRKFHRVSRAEVISDHGGSSSLRRIQTLISLIDEKKEPSNKRQKTRGSEESPVEDGNDDGVGNGRSVWRQRAPTSSRDSGDG